MAKRSPSRSSTRSCSRCCRWPSATGSPCSTCSGSGRRRAAIRTLVFFPVVLPTVAVALLFQRLFEVAPTTGPVNALLNVFGIASVDWFGTPDGLVLDRHPDGPLAIDGLLRRAALRRPRRHPRGDARVGPARRRQRLEARAAASCCRCRCPVLLSSIIFSINGTLKVFDSVLALTNGGPGNATTPLTLYMFQTSFTYGEYGYGSTIALMLTMLCLAGHALHLPLLAPRPDQGLTHVRHNRLRPDELHAVATASPRPPRTRRGARDFFAACRSDRHRDPAGHRGLPAGLAVPGLVQDAGRVPQRADLGAAANWSLRQLRRGVDDRQPRPATSATASSPCSRRSSSSCCSAWPPDSRSR